MAKPILERLSSKLTRAESGCLEWTAFKRNGYGRVYYDGRQHNTHRLVWELEHGTIVGDFQVDHLCHNRACSELTHLRLATRRQNQENRAGAQSNSISGVRGVRFTGGRYRVTARSRGVDHCGGSFDTIEDATAAAVALRAVLHDPACS